MSKISRNVHYLKTWQLIVGQIEFWFLGNLTKFSNAVNQSNALNIYLSILTIRTRNICVKHQFLFGLSNRNYSVKLFVDNILIQAHIHHHNTGLLLMSIYYELAFSSLWGKMIKFGIAYSPRTTWIQTNHWRP